MRITFRTLVLTAAALCSSAAFAATQSRVDVPFSFTAKGQSFPAGIYDVVLDAGNSFVTLANKADQSKHLTWTVGPAEPAATAALVKFDTTGTDYALKSIQLGTRVTPNLDRNNKRGVSATTSIGGE